MNPGDHLGHYTIKSHLGSGGMGAVYRATDTTLGRDVALKILPPEMAADPDRLERFRREARAIAALNHPHIVTIYSVEQSSGVHFLTMELLTGDALDTLLDGQAVPVDRLIEIAQAIASALAAAHDKGIVHRDLKPANVIATQSGPVKVLDFGLAKVQELASTPDAATQTSLKTEVGVVLGTPAYMSPEQVSGIGVDHRTDIFSLGVLLYELATGVRPFHGRSSVELASSILRDAPRGVTDVRPAVPPDLARVISRCLEKSPAARYPTMSEVHRALRSVSASARPAASEGPSVAVLPFQNLSADPANEFFGDGLAEEILNALTQIDGLRVAARASSFTFKGTSPDLADVGAKLRVSTVLTGSVRRAGNRVRVTVELVNAADGFRVWSERYDREMADIFDVQDEISRAIADKLKIALTGGAARLVKAPTANLEAYELYLKGRALLLKRGRHAVEGLTCLRRAVELDPRFGAAWAGLADALTVSGYWGVAPPGETMPKALTAARRAVALDPDSAESHTALAMTLLLWERDYAGAEAAFRRALDLNPNNTQTRVWFATFLQMWSYGRLAEGLEGTRQALAADPLSAYAISLHAMALDAAGRSEEAVEHARIGVARAPDSLLSHWVHGISAYTHRAFEESLEAFRTALEVSGNHNYPLASSVPLFIEWGRPAEAQAAYDRLVVVSRETYVPRTLLAFTSADLGDLDRAIDFAHEACDEREPMLLLYSSHFPTARRLQKEPRLNEIRRRMGLPARS